MTNLPDGLIVIVKRECETCQMVVPVLEQLASATESDCLHPR
jgi:thiol-disulfide isomerase/thioredoxin